MDYLNSALEVLKILNNNNYDAYIVGGYVRDYILNIDSNDIDMTSSATPEEVSKLFKTIPSGIKYGTVLICYNDYKFEHTTFRSDGLYKDSRHPNDVIFSRNVLDDLKRRDFTINSLLMNSNKEILDYLDGKKDINNKLIRTIGNPDNRFIEDALRMLRVFSFVSKLGFNVDEDTYLSIKKNKELLKNVSIERIRIEFDKISNGKYRKKAWHLFYELKLNELFPNMPLITDFDFSFRDILLKSLLENVEISDFWQLSKLSIRNMMKASNIVKEGVTDYNLFINGYIPSMYALEYLKMDKTKWDNLKIKSLKDLEINGDDLENIIGKTKRGECLNYLSKLVLEGKIENNYSILLDEAKKWNI